MRKWLSLFLLLLPILTFGQSARFQSQIIGSRGVPLANQNVAVCTQPANTSTTPCSPLATLATSTATTSGGTNPLPICIGPNNPSSGCMDGNGNFFFYAVPGLYTIQVYGPQVATPFVQPDVSVGASGVGSFTTLTVTGPLNATTLNNVQMCDQFAGATADLKITACIAALPSNGGTADARGLQGNQSFASTLIINKTITLLLGAAKITGPASGMMIDIQAPGVVIRGSGSFQNTGAAQGTVLVPVTSAQSHGIHVSATGNSNVQYKIQDLTITDSTAGGTTRTAGVGIFADANASPAQNSIGEVDNVYVSFMFTGIELNRPITSIVQHATVVQSKQDDFDFQGDGTSTWCIGCYGNFAGRHNFGFFGVNYSGCIGCASDHATQDGYHIARQSDTTGNQCIGISITNTGAEVDSTGGSHAGIYALDAVGLNLIGDKVLNSTGQGIWMDGARAVNISANVTGSTNNDINVTQSATPIFPAAINLLNSQYTTTGGAAFASTVTNMGYNGSTNTFSFAYPITPGVAGGSDLGATALPWGNLWLGTAATNNFKFAPAATAAARTVTLNDPLGNVSMPFTIASGTSAMTTALIAAGACGTTVTTTATGALTTDTIDFAHNAAVTNANGGILILNAWPTSGNVNFNYCNPTAAGVTPTAMTVNWSVRRP